MQAAAVVNSAATRSSITSPRKVALASFIGTTIEWYDFFLYQFATGAFFVALFFPHTGKDGMLYALGGYATAFIARPIGALVCGHFGDRIGRKAMLFYTLLLIGLSTVLIGCLPTYASIGILAPIGLIMLRFAQGFAVGGEWGGAVLMAVEHSSEKRRGFWGSLPQLGVPLGLFFATLVFVRLISLPTAVLIDQGLWRVGFLLSAILLPIGLYIRLKIQESPKIQSVKDKHQILGTPILEVLRHHPKNILLAAGAKLVENTAFYVFTFFILAYNKTMKQPLYSDKELFGAITVAALLGLITVPLFGWLSDLAGRKAVYLSGIILTGLFFFPFFALFETGQTPLLTLALIIALSIGHAAMYAPQASFFSELFDTKVRYSGASIGYQLATVIGGTFPLVAFVILSQTNGRTKVGLIFVTIAIISALSVYFADETFRKHID